MTKSQSYQQCTVQYTVQGMQYTAVYCNRVRWTYAVQCSAVQCSAVQWSAVQCSAVQCSTVQWSTVQCSLVQCSAVHSSSGCLVAQWQLKESYERRLLMGTVQHCAVLRCTALSFTTHHLLYCAGLHRYFLYCTVLKCNKISSTVLHSSNIHYN